MTTEFTTNYQLAKPDFNLFGWHDDVNGNSDTIDAILFTLTGFSNFVGTWTNSTNYTVGQRVLDGEDATIWNCLVAHTSAATDTFFDERVAHPTYWSSVATVPFDRGEWANNTFYGVGDVAHSTPDGLFGVCQITHTSSTGPATMRTDIANWSILFDSQDLTLASNIGFVPVGTIAGNNVQTAVAEVATDAAAALASAVATLNATDATLASKDIPAGTRMVFQQTAAPTGWTKETVHNNKALRLVTGTASTGGSTAFTTVFGSRTITTAQMPVHNHNAGTLALSDATISNGTNVARNPGGAGSLFNTTGGGGTSNLSIANATIIGHTQDEGNGDPIDFAVQYVDFIIATKN